ncbi:MAG: c-type cytochrome [Chitinophagaceae bacterium]|nr:MAG: c-type cytochrome [Chitinophagaceae bacterium]
MSTVIFLELLVILALLVNVKLMVKSANQRLATELNPAAEAVQKISWWSRVNKFRPVAQEADIDLGHDYDGIRELDNRLPPWWLYGFYVSIIFAVIYLWRFHVAETGLSSKQEYEQSVQIAEVKIQEYLKMKGESVNENTVTMLSSEEDLNAGRTLFVASCAACHKESGGGEVGPNLTDEYWLHGGDIKSIFKMLKYGFNAMPQWQNTYSNKQLAQISSYVKSLKGSNPANQKAPQGQLYKEEPGSATPVGDSLIQVKQDKIVMR